MRALVLAVAMGITMSFGALALADEGVDEQAVSAFNKGKEFFRSNRYLEASAAFRKAYGLKKTWKLQYNIGQSEAAAKRYGLALEALEHYLSGGGDEVPQERQQEVISEIERLRSMVGFLEVKGQEGDTVIVNDMERGMVPKTVKLRVAMGTAHVRVMRLSATIWKDEVEILGGETTVVDVTEGGTTKDAATSPVKTDDGGREKEGGKRLWTWVALGVGGAAGIAGGTVGIISINKKNDFMDACKDNSCLPSKKGDRDEVRKLSVTADVLYGVAAAGIIAGVVLFFVEGRTAGENDLMVAPIAASNSAGIAIAGEF